MSMPLRSLSATLLGLALLVAPAAGQVVTWLPGTRPRDVTPDGAFMVGARYTSPGNLVGVRWSGSPFLTELTGSTEAVGASTSGLLVAGHLPGPGTFQTEAARWFPIGGWQTLGPLPGGAHPVNPYDKAADISADGAVIVGSKDWLDDGVWVEQAYRWTSATGSVALTQAPGQNGSRGAAVSADGQVACGSLWTDQGWYAAVWRADGSVFYPAGGPGDPHAPRSYATELDGTGDTVVGGFLDTDDTWVWRADWGLVRLEAPADWNLLPGDSLVAAAVADGGALVAGGTGSATKGRAWIWTPAGGVQDLEELAEDAGLGSWPDGFTDPQPFVEVRDVSADGSRLVGVGDVPGGVTNQGGWVFDIPAPPAAPQGQWTNLGGGLSGVFEPTPVLTGAGVLTPGAETTLTLALQPAISQISLVIGLSRIDAPFKGGVMVPDADVVVSFLNLGQTAPISTSFPWPAGVPSGLELYWQYWMTSNGGPLGFDASNALLATAP